MSDTGQPDLFLSANGHVTLSSTQKYSPATVIYRSNALVTRPPLLGSPQTAARVRARGYSAGPRSDHTSLPGATAGGACRLGWQHLAWRSPAGPGRTRVRLPDVPPSQCERALVIAERARRPAALPGERRILARSAPAGLQHDERRADARAADWSAASLPSHDHPHAGSSGLADPGVAGAAVAEHNGLTPIRPAFPWPLDQVKGLRQSGS